MTCQKALYAVHEVASDYQLLAGTSGVAPAANRYPAVAAMRPPRDSGEPAVLVAPGSSPDQHMPNHQETSQRPFTQHSTHHLTGDSMPFEATAVNVNMQHATGRHSALGSLQVLDDGPPLAAAQTGAGRSTKADRSGMSQGIVAASHSLGSAAQGHSCARSSGPDAILASAAVLSALAQQSPGTPTDPLHDIVNSQTHTDQLTQPMSSAAMGTVTHFNTGHNSSNIQANHSTTMLSYSTQPHVQLSADSDAGPNAGPDHRLEANVLLAPDRGHMAAAGGRKPPASAAALQGQQRDGQAAHSSTLSGIVPGNLHAVGNSSADLGSLRQSGESGKVMLLPLLTSLLLPIGP